MKIILADDHNLVRESLCLFLEKNMDDASVSEAENLPDALEACGRERFDLAILDLEMPGMNGIEGIRKMRRSFPEIRIVIISGASLAMSDVQLLLKQGAEGFIPKSMGGGPMLDALKMVLSGKPFSPAVKDLPVSTLRRKRYDPSREPWLLFSNREKDVVHLLLDGMSNKEIALELGIEEITVKMHLNKIYRKLNVTSRTQAVTAILKSSL